MPARAHESSPVCWLSFPRLIDLPFETCVAALESSGGARAKAANCTSVQSRLRWPIEHDRDRGTCRIEAGLARGPLRPPLRMRLEIARWSPPSSRTALELIPCQRVRPTAAYFRSGHLLLDSLTRPAAAAPAGAATSAASPQPSHTRTRTPGRDAGPGDEPATSALKVSSVLILRFVDYAPWRGHRVRSRQRPAGCGGTSRSCGGCRGRAAPCAWRHACHRRSVQNRTALTLGEPAL